MKLYNYATKQKEEFQPIKTGEFKMYVCGITPYDSPHIGHILSAFRFNTIRNYLIYKGYKGTFVQNVTDIDDKIINRAKQDKISAKKLTAKYLKEYEDALAEFGIRKPDFRPKVTEYVDEIIAYICELISAGYAYTTPKGNVYFDVAKKSDYGKLSNKKTDELLNEAEGNPANDKKNPIDFALWKSEELPDFSWDSPWGKGRPGWHIECSVMANTILGESIDIHGGGLDLNFPHHENELAQSEAHNDKQYVKYWMYSGLLQINGVKMSKSLKNFVTAEEGIKKYGTELLAYVINNFHYRSNFNLQDQIFVENLNNVADFHRTLEMVENKYYVGGDRDLVMTTGEVEKIIAEFVTAMDDDFNTPQALVALNKLLGLLSKKIKENSDKKGDSAEDEIVHLYFKIKELGAILGLFQKKPRLAVKELLSFSSQNLNQPVITESEIKKAITKMKSARKSKKYEVSDKIRDDLEKRGIKIIQTDNEIYWKFLTAR